MKNNYALKIEYDTETGKGVLLEEVNNSNNLMDNVAEFISKAKALPIKSIASLTINVVNPDITTLCVESNKVVKGQIGFNQG